MHEIAKKDIAGLTAKEQLDKISEKTHQLVDLQYSTYNRSLVPALKQNGLRIVMEHEDLTEDEAAFADEYFHKMYIRSLHQWPLTHPDRFL